MKVTSKTWRPGRRWIRPGLLVLFYSLVLPLTAGAHSNEYLATIKGDHGGMLRMAEMYHFELKVANGEAHVWVTDHGDTPQSTRGANASLRVFSGNASFNLSLKAAGSNELMARDPRLSGDQATHLILTVAMAGEKPLQARYAMDARAAASTARQ